MVIVDEVGDKNGRYFEGSIHTWLHTSVLALRRVEGSKLDLYVVVPLSWNAASDWIIIR